MMEKHKCVTTKYQGAQMSWLDEPIESSIIKNKSFAQLKWMK
jgi:hypothetical protein